MPFSADREKNNDHKEDVVPYLASELHPSDLQEAKDCTSPLNQNSGKHEEEHYSNLAQSISHDNGLPQAAQLPENESDITYLGGFPIITYNSVPPEQSCVANHNTSVKLFLADQKDNLGSGPSNGLKPGLTDQNTPVNGSSEDQSDSVDFPHKSEAFPLKDSTDSPHSSSSEGAMKPSTNSGHASDFVHGTNHEDGLADGQNEVSTSASVMGTVPTTEDVCNNLEERTSQKPVAEEQTDDSSSLNQSILASPQSKMESSTPLTTQFVQGYGGKVDLDKEAVKLEGEKHFP